MSAQQTTAIGANIPVTIDGMDIRVPLKTTILDAAKELGIRIPTLCHHADLCEGGLCRVCVVEVEGKRTLQASCAYPITEPMKIKTSSAKVRKARKNILQLMLSNHAGDCTTCNRNQNCELQKLASEYGITTHPFGKVKRPKYAIDHSSLSVVRDNNKCILCRRCERTCAEIQGVNALVTANRGIETEIQTFMNLPLGDTMCINCGQCINRCPTGALQTVDATCDVWKAIDDPKKHVVIQTAPAPRAAIAECFGEAPGTPRTFEMNTALRRAGFNKVFDTNFTADLTILEEGTELLKRLYGALVQKDASVALPQFTSCSPGWIKYIEQFYPEYLPNVSSAKSPQQMFGALIKTYYAEKNGVDPKDIVSVSLMPCTAKKYECARPEMNDSGFKDIDYVLTTRELGKLIKEAGIDLPQMPKSDFDEPFGTATGSGVIFGATGGVMESAIRTVVELVCGIQIEDLFEHANVIPVRGFEGVRYAELPISAVGPVPEVLKDVVPDWNWLKDATLKVAICHGTANAQKVMDDIRAGGKFSECHFIEFMACPGGCLGGGGQPIPTNKDIRSKRANAIYAEDMAYTVRKSHLNEAVLRLYKEFLTDGIGGHKAHHLLHTSYTDRSLGVRGSNK